MKQFTNFHEIERLMKYNPKMVPFYFHTINMAAMKISGVGSKRTSLIYFLW